MYILIYIYILWKQKDAPHDFESLLPCAPVSKESKATELRAL
jgi:hypothetical protein